jgi:hypothetical protein
VKPYKSRVLGKQRRDKEENEYPNAHGGILEVMRDDGKTLLWGYCPNVDEGNERGKRKGT